MKIVKLIALVTQVLCSKKIDHLDYWLKIMQHNSVFYHQVRYGFFFYFFLAIFNHFHKKFKVDRVSNVQELDRKAGRFRRLRISYSTDIINHQRFNCDVEVRAVFTKFQTPIFARQISEPTCTLENLETFTNYDVYVMDP